MKLQLRDKIHPTLLGMWRIMALWGVLMQVIILIATKRRLYYSVGAWAGVLTAILWGGMMLHAISNTMDREGRSATIYSYSQYVLRLLLVIAVFFFLALTGLRSVPAAFIGMFSLKISAYLQPRLYRFFADTEGGNSISNGK